MTDQYNTPGSKIGPHNDEVVNVFKDIVTAMNVTNGDQRIWWYTWLASRDRFNAALWRRLCFLSSVSKGDINQQTDDPVLLGHLAEVQSQLIVVPLFDRMKWGWQAFTSRLRTIRQVLAEVMWFVQWWQVERAVSQPKQADVIVVTQLSVGSFKDGRFIDPYFGDLYTYLQKNGEQVVVCGTIQGDPSRIITLRHKSELGNVDAVTSLGSFIRAGDFGQALKEVLFNQIQAVDFLLPFGGNAKDLLSDDINCARPHMFHGLMIELATARMLEHYSSARIIHIYENNPWEHAIDRQGRIQNRDRIGFLHCAVLPSHLKNYIADAEKPFRPAPDLIVCTGSGAKDVFLSLGNHNPDNILAGCDLRRTVPRDIHPRAKHRKAIRNVLVVFEALPNMAALLRFIEMAAKKFSDTVFSVREHPALPLTGIADKAGIELHPNGPVLKSTENDLFLSLKAADVVIYQGTTVAMTAVYLGVPSIKIDNNEGIENDPLFESAHLKWRAQNLDDLQAAFQEISDLDQSTYIQERDYARAYVEKCFASPSDVNMSAFLKTVKIASE